MLSEYELELPPDFLLQNINIKFTIPYSCQTYFYDID